MIGVAIELYSNIEFHAFITCPAGGCINALFTIASTYQYLGMLFFIAGLASITYAYETKGKIRR